MKKNNEDWLDKLHHEEVMILEEFDRVCRKNGLKYFLTGGTLIGAVRHKGFIPWDDDIDIAMPRDDYNKFIKLSKLELSDDYYLQAPENSRHISRFYAKLKLKNTAFVENSAKNAKKFDTGIWIDIFPYDNYDSVNTGSIVKKSNFKEKISLLLSIKYGLPVYFPEFSRKHKIIMFFIKVFAKICPCRLLTKITTMVISSNKNKNSKYTGTLTGWLSLEREIQEREDLYPLVELEFEGKMFYCPKNYDKVLTKVYGNYMKLPPKDQRVTHKPVYIKFFDGTEVSFDNNDN